jgi:hypothetical protein
LFLGTLADQTLVGLPANRVKPRGSSFQLAPTLSSVGLPLSSVQTTIAPATCRRSSPRLGLSA